MKNKITMTTLAEKGAISLDGSGTVSIDWGDASETETREFIPDNFGCANADFTHRYSVKHEHAITITGENTACITGLTVDINHLTALDVSQNTALERLCCCINYIKELDVRKNVSLETLCCGHNFLTTLDVSHNTALEALFCDGNGLSALDVSQNTALEIFDCSHNNLTALDVSRNTALEHLFCDFNQLTALDVSKNPALDYLECNNNLFSAAALNALFETLPENTVSNCYIDVKENPGAEECDASIAENKGWKVIKESNNKNE